MGAVRGRKLVGQSGISVRVLLYVLIFLTSTAFSFSSYRVFAPAKEAVFLCLTALLCFMDRVWLYEQVKALKTNVADGVLGGLAGYLIVVTFLKSSVSVAVLSAIHCLLWFGFYLVVKHQFIYEDDMIGLLNVLGVSLFVNLVFGAAQVTGIYLPAELSALEGPVGLIGNTNWFAIYVALLLMPEIWFVMTRRSKPRMVLAVLNIVMGLPLLYLTYCRGAFAAFLTTLAMFAIMRHWGNDVANLKKRIGLFLSIGILMMFGALILSVYSPSLLLKVWSGRKQQNIECRLLAYRITWNAVKDAPLLGHGLRSFGNDYPKLQAQYFEYLPDTVHGRDWKLARPFRHVHNDILELAYEGGIIALVLCLSAGFYVVKKFFFSAQRIPAGPGRQLSHLLFSVAIGFIVASVASFPAHQTTSAMIFAIMLGGLTFEVGGGRREHEKPGMVLTGVSLITSLTFISICLCVYMSSSLSGEAYNLFKRGEIEDAQKRVTNALNMNPYNGKALSLLARCYESKGEFDKATELFEQAANYHYDSSCAFNLGIISIKKRDNKAAEEHFTRSLRECPSPPGFLALGNVARFKADFDKAERMYTMALELDRGYGEAAHKLARLYMRQRKYDLAVSLLRDNINVFDARLGEVPATGEAAVLFVKDLKLLKKAATIIHDNENKAYAESRLKKLESK